MKVTQAKKSAETFPFPMAVARDIPRTAKAAAWEVWELKIKLLLLSKPSADEGAQPEVSVEREAASQPASQPAKQGGTIHPPPNPTNAPPPPQP